MTTDEQTSAAARNQTVLTLIWFLGLTTLFASVAYYFVIEHGLRRYYVSFLMWTPALAALLTCKIRAVDLSVLGWRWPSTRWVAAGYVLPALYGAVAYAIIWGGGFGGLIDPKFAKGVSYFLGLADWSEGATLAFGILMFGTVGMIWHLATALGEEIGWRGFLTPILLRLMSFPLASLAVGLIWALWHLPLIIWTKYNAGPTDIELQFLNYTLMTVGMSFILTYLRARSNSLWPAVILHASHNIYVLTIMQPMTVQYKETWRYAGEFGFILPLVILAVGMYFWWRYHGEEKAAAAVS